MNSLLYAALLLALGWAVETSYAYPYNYNCNGASWVADLPFNEMSIAKLSAATDETCKITGVPNQYAPCGTYEITITSGTPMGHKLQTSSGALQRSGSSLRQEDNCFYVASGARTSTYLWKAPTNQTTTASFHALCGRANTFVYTTSAVTIMTTAINGTDLCSIIPTTPPSSEASTRDAAYGAAALVGTVLAFVM